MLRITIYKETESVGIEEAFATKTYTIFSSQFHNGRRLKDDSF